MSKALALKMDERIFDETERVLRQVRMPRNAYINRAVDFYNRCQKRRMLKKMFKKEAVLLKKDTQAVLESFELLDDVPD